jgi:hypothetical protein
MSKWQALSDILQVLHLLNNKEPCYYHSSFLTSIMYVMAIPSFSLSNALIGNLNREMEDLTPFPTHQSIFLFHSSFQLHWTQTIQQAKNSLKTCDEGPKLTEAQERLRRQRKCVSKHQNW